MERITLSLSQVRRLAELTAETTSALDLEPCSLADVVSVMVRHGDGLPKFIVLVRADGGCSVLGKEGAAQAIRPDEPLASARIFRALDDNVACQHSDAEHADGGCPDAGRDRLPNIDNV